jgi:hypothetical protein
LAALGSGDALGLQLFDVHALSDEHSADFADNPRAILAYEVKFHERLTDNGWNSYVRMDDRLEAGGRQSPQSLGQRVGLIGVYLDSQDPRKLPREMGHAALDPVAAMLGDDAGERLDEAGSIGAEHGEDEGGGAHTSTRKQNR